MPEPHLPIPAQPAMPPGTVEAVARWVDDADIALGCECADPALQIERWSQEFLAGSAEG
jgi:hypothetical protein